MRFFGAAALAIAGFITISCGGVTDPSQNTTEMFSGTVQKGGLGPVHTFNVKNTGEYTIKVTGFTPNFSTQFGVIFGVPSGDSCAQFGVYPTTLVNFPISSSVVPGTYCVQVYDVGLFTTAETYTMTVSHP